MRRTGGLSPEPLAPIRGSRVTSQAGPGISRRSFIIGSGALVVGLAGVGEWLGQGAIPTDNDVLLLVEKTTRAPGELAPPVRSRMLQIAQGGGGQLSPYAGGAKISPLPPVSLTVQQQGETVNDPDRLASTLRHRLDALNADLARVPVGQHGFNLVAALKTISDASHSVDRLEAWLQTTVLTSSANPLRLTALLAAEPKAAVDQVRATSMARLDLSRVELHLVLVNPVGDDQPPLSVRADQWREDFLVSLASALGADVIPAIHDANTAAPWRGSSAVEAIITAEDPTPTVRSQPPDVDGQPPVGIDTAAFKPDSDQLLNPAAVTPKLEQVAERYRAAAGHYPITCTGYCARFGDPTGARVLSAARAEVIRRLLITDQHVPDGDVHATGVGFDQRADPTADPQSPAQRVVLMRLVSRSSA